MVKFDLKACEAICRMKEKQFKSYATYDKKGRYFFKDNDSKILAVAHLDSVQNFSHFQTLKLPHKELIFCPTLDDRLGAFLLLNHLPKLGLKYDILLTTDEEIARTTADNFDTDKQYHWMFQFDRSGKDVVMYDYETVELKFALTKLDFKVGKGSFSDISNLDFLGCKGFNFGVSYQDYHSKDAYADITELQQTILKFQHFYHKFKDVYLPHIETRPKYTENWRYYDRLSDEYYNDYTYNPTSHTYKKHDIWTFACSGCGNHTEVDLDECSNLSLEAAEENYCLKCYQNYIADIFPEHTHGIYN